MTGQKTMGHIDYTTLYRLPFSKNDNFNGWIEITTRCNITCPGCYRLCNQPGRKGEHKSLEDIKHEIQELKRIRNCSMISISGGEPLLHPDIGPIIHYVKSLKMQPILFTNGTLLTHALLKDLKKAGLTSVVIRIDTLQHQYGERTESNLNTVRNKYADLLHNAGLYFTNTICIDHSNLSQIKDVVTWAGKNSDKVGQLLLILKRALVFKEADIPSDDQIVTREDLITRLQEDIPDLRFAAFLGSSRENLAAKWMQAFRLVSGKKILGYVDKKFVELLQITYHYHHGNYPGIVEKKKNFMTFFAVLLAALINKSMRKICRRFLIRILINPFNIFRKAAVQALTVVVPPHFVDGKRDLCDACPDAILYNGELVPSCSLEEIRTLGKMYEIDGG